jgi:hypothetical protein
VAYAVGDVATYDGRTWYRVNSNGGNVGDTPAEGTFWVLVADKGASGASGVPGASGEPGASGAAGASGASGASGGTGGIGGLGASGASGVGASRVIQTLTANATLGASGGTDYVVYTNIATIAASPDFEKNVAVLRCDGANASTTITDSGYLASNWTANGNAKLSTTTKKYGTASVEFDGLDTSYIRSTAAASNFTFGSSSDFTIEFWIFPNSGMSSGDYGVMDFFTTSNSSTNPYFYLSNNIPIFGPLTTGTSTALTVGQWSHIAITRSSGTSRMFVDGVVKQSGADSTNYGCTAVTFGRWYINNNHFRGFIDDIRILKTFAAYTSTFTPPTDFPTPTATVLPSLSMPAVNTSMYRLWNLNSEALPVKPQTGQTIDGATGISLSQGDKKLLLSDGATGWRSW